MNPHKVMPYVRAKEMEIDNRRQMENEIAYLNGIYVRDALLCTVCNMLGGKSSKKFEYPKEPYEVFQKQEEPHELTEEEKIKKTEELFLRLNIMKSNFDLAKN